MWFGTKDGLNRYDGKRFKVYKHDASDTLSLPENYTTAIFEDREGRIWVGSQRAGIAYFDRQTETFHKVRLQANQSRRGDKDSDVHAIAQDHDGNIWVATVESGLFCLKARKDGHFRVIRRFETGAKANAPQALDDFISLKIANDGTIWTGCSNGLAYFDKEKNALELIKINTRHPDAPHDVLEDAVTTIYEDADGIVWLGALSSAVAFDPKTRKNKLYPHKYEVNRYGWGRVHDIVRDNEGLFWLGTPAGLMIFSPATGLYGYISHDPFGTLISAFGK